MPEWLSTDNIAIVFMGVVSVTLWRANESLRKEAKNALREGIEMERDRTAEIMSMSAVVSSMQRAIVALDASMQREFAVLQKHTHAIYRHVKD